MTKKLTPEELQDYHNRGQKDAAEGHFITSPRSPDVLFTAFDRERSDQAWDAYQAGKHGDGRERRARAQERERRQQERAQRDADERERISERSSSSSDSSSDDLTKLVMGLLILGLALAAIAAPFVPIYLFAKAISDMIGAGGALVGIIVFVGLMVLLWKVRIARAIYFFPYAAVVVGAVFLFFLREKDQMTALGFGAVAGLLLYRFCFEALRWRYNGPTTSRTWLVSSALSAGTLAVMVGAAAMFPSLTDLLPRSGPAAASARPPNPAFARAETGLPPPAPMQPALPALVGDWWNSDPDTGWVTHLILTGDMSDPRVQVFGKCTPTDCDWGSQQAIAVVSDGGLRIRFNYAGGDSEASFIATVRPEAPDVLQLTEERRYQDRPPTETSATFVRRDLPPPPSEIATAPYENAPAPADIAPAPEIAAPPDTLAVPPAEPAPAAAPRTRPIPDRERFARLIVDNYPPSARRGRQEGDVTVSMCVSAEGRAFDLAVVTSGGNEALDAATLRSLPQLTFTPAKDAEGRNVPWCSPPYMMTVQWRLP
jgi:protein TonB